MKNRFCLLLGAVLMVLAGCASAPPTVAPGVADGIKRVAVISMVADSFRRMHVGFTAFGNEYETVPIAEWGLDQDYERQLALAAEQLLSATSVKVAYRPEDFRRVNDLKGPWDAPAFWGPNFEAIEKHVTEICTRESLDALLVVAKRKRGDLFGGTNQAVSAAGIYTRRGISLLHLLAVVSLHDCKTGKSLASRDLGTTASQGRGGGRPPVVSIPEELSRKPSAEWTPEMVEQVRTTLRDLPKPVWGDTLKSMLPPR